MQYVSLPSLAGIQGHRLQKTQSKIQAVYFESFIYSSAVEGIYKITFK